MWLSLLNVLTGVTLFSGLDRLLTFFNFEGVYYGIHSLHNVLLVTSAWKDVMVTFTNFNAIDVYSPNYEAIELCFALHLYHCLLYWKKFRTDDWLHHGLMIGIALPLGCLVPSATLVGFNLFFTTGLPGAFDYAMLFCVRNGWMGRMEEKDINRLLNVWIRSPGCQWHFALTCVHMFRSVGPWYVKMAGFVPAALTYWNGQYFMEQVVADHAAQVERARS